MLKLGVSLLLFLSFLNLQAQTTRAVIIGVSKYKNLKGKDLPYAKNDAKGFYNFLINESIVQVENAYFLTDDSTSNKDDVLEKISNVFLRSSKNDIVIIFFAGHGAISSIQSTPYLLLTNVDNTKEYARTSALRMDDINDYIKEYTKKGIKVLLIVDACHSGNFIGDEETQRKANDLISAPIVGGGVKILACRADEKSKEILEFQHGIFTYYLLEGVKGAADDNKDFLIRTNEISNFLKLNVTQKNPQQHPIVSGDTTMVLFKLNNKTVTPILKNISSSYSLHDLIYFSKTYERGIELEIEPRLSILSQNILKYFKLAIENKYLYKHKFLPNQVLKSEKDTISFSFIEPIKTKNKKDGELGLTSLAVSPTGKYLITGGKQKKAYFLDSKLKTTQVLSLDAKTSSFAFSDNENVMCIANGKKIDFYATFDMKLIASFAYTENIKSVLFLEKIQSFVFTTQSEIVVCDISSLKITLTRKLENIQSILWMDDLLSLAVAHENKVSVFDAESFWQVKYDKETDIGKILTLAYDYRNKTLFVGGESKHFLGLDLNDNLKEKLNIPFNNANPEANCTGLVYLEAKSNYVVRGGLDHILEYYDPVSGKYIKSKLTQRATNDLKYNILESKIYLCDNGNNIGIVKNETLQKTAVEYLKEMETIEELKDEIAIYKNQVAFMLKKDSEELLNSYSNSDVISMSQDSINEIIFGLEIAENLMNHDQVFKNLITKNKLSLKGYKIIDENDVKKYAKAETFFIEILKMDPYLNYPWIAIAKIESKRLELEKAKANLTKASINVPFWSEIIANLGKVLVKEGKYSKAISQFQNIIKAEPNNSRGYHLQSQLYIKLGMLKKAETLSNIAHKISKNDIGILIDLAYLESLRGRYPEAKTYLEKAKKVKRGFYETMLAEANIDYLKFKKHNRSKTYIKELNSRYLAVLKNEKAVLNPKTWLDYGNFRQETLFESNFSVNEIETSIDTIKIAFDNALSLDPFSADAYNGLANLEQTKQNIFYKNVIPFPNEKAKEIFLKSIQLTDKFPEAYYFYGKFWEQFNDTTQALIQYETSYKLDPNFTPTILALLTLNGNDDKNFISQLNKDSLISNCPMLSFQIAFNHYSKGNLTGAKKYLNITQTSDSKYNYVYHGLKEMDLNIPSILKPIKFAPGKVVLSQEHGLAYIQKNEMDTQKKYFVKFNRFNTEIDKNIIDTIFALNNFVFVNNQSFFNSPSYKNYTILTKTGVKIIDREGLSYQFLTKNTLAIQLENGKKSYLYNADGKQLIKESVDSISYFKNLKLISCKNSNGKFFCINLEGKVVLKPLFKSIEPFTSYKVDGHRKVGTYFLKCKESGTDKIIIYNANGKVFKEINK